MSDNVTKPIEGLAFLEFDLKLPTKSLSLASRLTHHEASTIFETVYDYGWAEIAFRVTSVQFLDTVMKALESEGNPLIRFRWGLGAGDSVAWTPWQLHYVFRYQAVFEGIGANAGHFIKFHTRDLLHLIDRSSKTKAHRGSVSSIVKKLATANNLTEAVVEETHGEGVWVQSYEGDFEFARSRLVSRARSTRGRGNYYLFVRDNVLHFHTVEYQTTIHDFAYYQSSAFKLEAIDLSQAKIEDGSAGVRVVYHDPYSGLSKEVASDPEKAIRFANSIPRLDKVFGAQRNICEHKIQIRDDEAGVVALAQNAYEYARAECFQLKFQTSKTTILRAGDLLRINIDPNSSTTSPWGGIYLISSAQHILTKGEINSVYVLQRGEQQVARNSSNALAAYGVDTLQDQQNAPGFDLNVREAQASVLTKGAGKALTSGVYLTVQDKSKAQVPPSQITPQT